jgi:signal transduction histidine kinase
VKAIRPSIHVLVILVVLTPILAVSVSLLILTQYTSDQVESELASALVRTSAQRVSDQLSNAFSTAELLSDLYVHRVQSGSLPDVPHETWQRFLFESMLIRPTIGAVTYGSPDGRVIYVMRVNDQFVSGLASGPEKDQTIERRLSETGTPVGPPIRLHQYAVTKRPWYRTAMAHERPVWTDIYQWFTEASTRTYGGPVSGIGYVRQIHQGDKLLGVLLVDLTLKSLGRALQEADITRFGTVMIVDAEGRMIASSHPIMHATDKQLPSLSDSSDPVAVAASQALAGMSGDTKSTHIARLSRHVYVETIRPVPTLKWRLVTILPDTSVTGQSSALKRNAILLGAAIVGMTLALGLLLSTQLSRPVARLAAHVKQIGQGKFDTQIHLTSTAEFAQLSDAINDMTRNVQAQVQLRAEKASIEQAAEAKNAFFSRVTHELRTPLNAIIGYAEMIEEQEVFATDSSAREDLRHILQASYQLLQLINDLMDLSRAESGHVPIRLTDCRLSELVREVEQTARPLVAKNRNALTIDLTPDLPTLHTDPQKLRQILLNLLSNASKFTENGSIHLKIHRDQAHAYFTVTDTGQGMETSQIQRMFEPFTQGDCVVGGTGLGLAIVRQFTHLLGGEIEINSKLGSGTIVHLIFPTDGQAVRKRAGEAVTRSKGTP